MRRKTRLLLRRAACVFVLTTFAALVLVAPLPADADTPITWFVETGAPIPNSTTPCPARTASHPRVGKPSSAVKCALGGDTVNIAAATFVDHVIANKALTFVGAGSTTSIIDGNGTGAVFTVAAGKFITFSDIGLRNGVTGLLVKGGMSATRLNVGPNTGNGVVVSTPKAVQIGPAADIHHNGLDGIRITRASGDRFTLSGYRATLRSDTIIHDNAGNGVTVGVPYGSTLPPIVNVQLGDADITGNQRGISVRDDGSTDRSNVILLDNDVYQNRGEGLWSGRAVIGQPIDGANPPTFAQNKFHCNDLNQVVFDGGGEQDYPFPVDSPTHFCDAGSNAVYCYAAKQVFGIFAQGNAAVFVRHTEFEGGGTGLKDFSAQSGSTINVSNNCTAITVCP